jgi:farnesyl diphosphate synthase
MNNYTTKDYLNRHEETLHQLMAAQSFPSQRLKDAMYYTLFPGGKRIRPLLVYLAGELLETRIDALDSIAAAIELTHCYSLVHDDLPAMDNDDFRRGKPSCHRAFDEGTAILVGDALQIFAIDMLVDKLPAWLTSEQILHIISALTKASGPEGMISGQCLDLYELSDNRYQENRSNHETVLHQIHALKTSELMLACMNMVIAASDSPVPAAKQALQDYAKQLGLAFQMQDDYLDRYANPDLLGKGRASDACNEKLTFADCFSQHELSTLIDTHYAAAQTALHCFGNEAQKLQQLTQDLVQRGNR